MQKAIYEELYGYETLTTTKDDNFVFTLDDIDVANYDITYKLVDYLSKEDKFSMDTPLVTNRVIIDISLLEQLNQFTILKIIIVDKSNSSNRDIRNYLLNYKDTLR